MTKVSLNRTLILYSNPNCQQYILSIYTCTPNLMSIHLLGAEILYDEIRTIKVISKYHPLTE